MIKVILSILFFLCLLDMPYGYFQLVRFAALAGFAWLAFKSIEQGYNPEAFIYVCLAVLFQPIIKIALGRQIWNGIDITVGVVLIVSVFIRSRDNN